MSDWELETIRRKKLLQLKKSLEKRSDLESEKAGKPSDREVLSAYLADRAWEVLNAAKIQYPEAGSWMEATLAKLIREGKIKTKISGEELYSIFLRLGVKVRLPTRIKVLEHGEIKSLEQKIKEETSENY
ncbi:MAG: DNA-binding protein [Nitrososphaerota archaeon]|nr:hypothetical protein [Candidatus Bathyarchaeota archaeon]MDW8049327.1 DNA-binding protein [Nitrososphaerota archaeon]